MKKWRIWIGWALGLSRILIHAAGAEGLQITMQPADGGAMEVTVSGGSNGWYVIDASSDSVNWSFLAKAPVTSEPFKNIDYVAQIFPNRFYRAAQFCVPGNDNFSKRETLTGTNLVVTGWNFGATSEPSEPPIALLESGSNSVWWSWTSPGAGTVSISTVGTFWDTLLAVFTGESVTNLVPVAQFPWHTRELNFPVQAGVVYQIAVAGSADEAGPLNFTLTYQPKEALPSPRLGGASVNLLPYQYPDVESYSLQFSEDAKVCSLSFADDPGATPETTEVADYLLATPMATIDLATYTDQTDAHRFQFSFTTENSGTYLHKVNDEPADSGQFTNFRSKADRLALKSLAGVKLTGTRVWTSTGTSGQSHHYTFNHGGHFHDSDSPEQATGRYQYEAGDETASLVLDYTGPADFAGDHHELSMTFTSVNGGTFTSHYAKNDGTQITILGVFVIDED